MFGYYNICLGCSLKLQTSDSIFGLELRGQCAAMSPAESFQPLSKPFKSPAACGTGVPGWLHADIHMTSAIGTE